MRTNRSNFVVYSTETKVKVISKPADILDLLQKNKREEKKERTSKILVVLSFLLLALFLSLIIVA